MGRCCMEDIMSSNSILLDFLISIIGMGYFIYGKKSVNIPFIISGVILSIYPYFVSGIILTIIIGLAIIVAPFVTDRYFN
jgi:hypothetical protein